VRRHLNPHHVKKRSLRLNKSDRDSARLSVIIPTKNEGNYLERTLRNYLSLKNVFNFEIIVSDGGSTDQTVEIAKKYADIVITIRNGDKQNIAMGRTAGARVAKGKVLFHTDADVTVPSPADFIGNVLGMFDNSNVVAVTCPIRVYPDEETLKDLIFHKLINLSTKWSISLGFIIGRGECQFVRRTTFESVRGYDENIIVGEDGDLFHRLKKLGKIVYLNDVCVHHSPRRFRNQGYLKVIFLYIREGYSLLIRGKSYLSEWDVQR
jgi:glycosyltransferase involved in cell wall biosynthesis